MGIIDVGLPLLRVSPREAIPLSDFLLGAPSFLCQSSAMVELQPPHRRGGLRSEDGDSPRTMFEVHGCLLAVRGVFYFPKPWCQ
jgi:hypothetical protein